MSLKYIAEKLFAAVESLALDTRSLQERLGSAYLDSVSKVRLFADCLPEEERRLFDSIAAKMTKREPTGDEGSIAATVRAMHDTEAARLVRKILMLLQMVTWALAIQQPQEGQGTRFPYHPSDN